MMDHPFHDAMQCRERLKARRYSVQTRDGYQCPVNQCTSQKIPKTFFENCHNCRCLPKMHLKAVGSQRELEEKVFQQNDRL